MSKRPTTFLSHVGVHRVVVYVLSIAGSPIVMVVTSDEEELRRELQRNACQFFLFPAAPTDCPSTGAKAKDPFPSKTRKERRTFQLSLSFTCHLKTTHLLHVGTSLLSLLSP